MIKLHEGRKKIELTDNFIHMGNKAECEFILNENEAEENICLRFGVVTNYIEVWMNDVYLGSHEGTSDSVEFDITQNVRYEDKNTVVVKNSVSELATSYRKKEGIDFNKIWDCVELVLRPDVFIEQCKIYTKTVWKKDCLGDGQDKKDGSAMVCMDVILNNRSKKTVVEELSALIKPYNFESKERHEQSRKVVLPQGVTSLKFVMTVMDASLWYTWDYGYPNLYYLRLRCANDSVEMRFGIKDMEYDEKAGAWYLNDKKIFLRGLQYSGQHIEQIIEMNLNAIRIEGGMENEKIYSECDEHGVLIWKTFPYCSKVKNHALLAKASDKIRDNGMLLTNHVCVGIWSVYDEILKETLQCIEPARCAFLEQKDVENIRFLKEECVYAESDPSEYILPFNIFGAAAITQQTQIMVKEQIEYIRQHKYYPVSSMYMPGNKEMYPIIAAAYNPVLISLEPCIKPFRCGQKKELKMGATFTARVWVHNDYLYSLSNICIKWKVTDLNEKKTVAEHCFSCNMPANSVEIPDHIVLPLKEEFNGHEFRVYMSVLSEDTVLLSENYSDFRVTE